MADIMVTSDPREPTVGSVRTETTGGEEHAFEIGGSAFEALGGAAAVVLGILGLVHVAPAMVAAIATIVIGAAFLLGGAAFAARFSRVLSRTEPRVAAETVGGGMAMESLCGAAGIVLGILALAGAGTATLLPVAAIVFGAGLLAATGTLARMSDMAEEEFESGVVRPVGEGFGFVAGPEVMIALAGVILGILALVGISPIILSLVSMLIYGVAILLSGASFASSWFMAFAAR